MKTQGWVIVDTFFNPPTPCWESAAKTRKKSIERFIEWQGEINKHITWRDWYRVWDRRCVRCEVVE